MKSFIIFATTILLVFMCGSSFAQSYTINWQVVSSSGTQSSSGGNELSATVGQAAIGPSESSSNRAYQGFWQNLTPGSCCVLAGDATHNGAVDILDIILLINFRYKGGVPPVCQGEPERYPEADATGNGVTDILDIIRLINYRYKGGLEPICGPM